MESGKSSQTSLSKADYLKKYLSGGDSSSGDKPKKLKKKAPPGTAQSRVRVVDDDADDRALCNDAAVKKPNRNAFDDHDDASDPDEVSFRPTVAEIIDERPEEVQIMEKFSSSGKWKSVGDDDPSKRSLPSHHHSYESYKRKPGTPSVSSRMESVRSVADIKEEEQTAGIIILPDVRKSTAMRKKEEQALEQKLKEDERQAQYSKWSKGLAQIAQQKERAEEAFKEMAKPLARYADDEDLEKMLKEKDRIGDPMLAFKKGKKHDVDDEEAASSGGAAKRPARGPPNRFGIPPGLRWDGVDRSNGFERDLFLKMADRKTIRQEEYIWSVEDW